MVVVATAGISQSPFSDLETRNGEEWVLNPVVDQGISWNEKRPRAGANDVSRSVDAITWAFPAYLTLLSSVSLQTNCVVSSLQPRALGLSLCRRQSDQAWTLSSGSVQTPIGKPALRVVLLVSSRQTVSS